MKRSLSLSPRSPLRWALAVVAILMAAGSSVPTATSAYAAKCFASGSGAPLFCRPKACPSGYEATSYTNEGCFEGRKYFCCQTEAAKKADFERRDKGYKCAQLYCAKVCTGNEKYFVFCRPKSMSFAACQAKCNRL
jgi:hypothetical protein